MLSRGARLAAVGMLVIGLCTPAVAYGDQGPSEATTASAVVEPMASIPARVKKVCDTVAWYASAGKGRTCLTTLINATNPCKPSAKQSRVQYGVGEDRGEYYIAYCMTTYDGSGMWYGHSWLREYAPWMMSPQRVGPNLGPNQPEASPPVRVTSNDLTSATWDALSLYVASQRTGGAYEKVVRLLSRSFYRAALRSVSIVVDPGMDDAGKYECSSNRIRLPVDPRGALTPGQRLSLGETAWHELTHAIEDHNGDCGAFDPPIYQERHVDYMTLVKQDALPKLDRMESAAREGRSVGAVRSAWIAFLNQMEWAYIRSGMGVYPASMGNLMPWFGFSVDVEKVRNFYASGKALKGKAGEVLKRAVSAEPPDPEDVGGTDWTVYDWLSGSWRSQTAPVTITQRGTRLMVMWNLPDSSTGGTAGSVTMTLTIREQPEDAPGNNIAYAAGTFEYEGRDGSNPLNCASGRINMWFENFSWQIFGAHYCSGELAGNFRFYRS